jgi:hypothetical protein
MKPRQCVKCQKDTFKEYVITWSGGGRRHSPSVHSAWLCSDECAEVYFTEREQA